MRRSEALRQAAQAREKVVLLTSEANVLLNIIDEVQNGVSWLEQIEAAYLEFAEKRLLDLIRVSFQADFIKDLLKTYNALPPNHRVRLHLSTEMSVYLDGYDFNGVGLKTNCIKADRIYSAIKREYLIANAICGLIQDLPAGHEAVWSPYGDVSLTSSINGNTVVKGQLVLSNGSVLDTESPIATAHNPTSGTLSQPRLQFLESEIVLIVQKLEKALVLLEACNPVYRKIVDIFAKRIVLRKSAENYEQAVLNGRTISSDHTTSHFGCIRFLNFHLEEKSISSCAESLLHESLHVLLSSWERIYGDFSYKGKEVRAISPWSGNLIPDSSFSHAIIIYYCCLRLYIGLAHHKPTSIASEGDRIRCRSLEILYGFFIPNNLLSLFGRPDKVTKEYARIAETLQQTVINRYLRTSQGVVSNDLDTTFSF